MKGYRTPSWFRIKGRAKEARAKARTSQPRGPRAKEKKWEASGDPV